MGTAIEIKSDMTNVTLGSTVQSTTNRGLTIGKGTNGARDIALDLDNGLVLDKDLMDLFELLQWTDLESGDDLNKNSQVFTMNLRSNGIISGSRF